MLIPYLCIETLLVGMIEHLSHALLIILSNVLTRKILIFCEFSACISIYNAELPTQIAYSDDVEEIITVYVGVVVMEDELKF